MTLKVWPHGVIGGIALGFVAYFMPNIVDWVV